ncbi:MAG TPA: EamA family transporter [Casimicrobiaceae bacterium]|nr:EamA family transporter [Casimicrobiaceae bacterium]
MSWTAFSFLLAGVLLNAGAQLLLKAGTNTIGVIGTDWARQFGRAALEPHIAAGLGCYVVSVAVWIVGLSRVPVSVAYPMLSLGYIVNAVAAQYLLGESVTFARWLGIGFIVVGVWLVARS